MQHSENPRSGYSEGFLALFGELFFPFFYIFP